MHEAAKGPSQYFDFLKVEPTDPFWVDVQRLRYDVYCDELNYLNPANYPEKLETDEFDPFSIQIAGINNEKEAVATLRLVRDSHLGFPLERHAPSLFRSLADLPRDKTLEVSRLILARQYRRRANDGRYGTGGVGVHAGARPAPARQRRSPYPLILFGLFRVMFQESLNSGYQWWLAAMEPWLQTFLERFGFVFAPVGGPIEYYGQVVPYAARIEDIFQTVARMKPEVLQMVLGGGEPG